MLQRPGGMDLGELIQKYLGPILVGFFVFVVPAIKAAATAKKQREELKRRTEERGAAPPGEAQEGRKAWEDLLQGRGAPPSAAPVEEPLDEEESLEDNPPPPLVALPSAGQSTREAEGDEEEVEAEAYVDARERQETQRQKQISAAEYVASSPYRPGVAPPPASAVPVVAMPAPMARGAAEIWLFPTEPARDRKAALRRAIVLREVLGPPLSLR